MKKNRSFKSTGRNSSTFNRKPIPKKSISKKSTTLTKPGQEVSGRIAVGLHAVKEILKIRPEKIKIVYLKEGWESSKDLVEISSQIQKRSIPQRVVSDQHLSRFSHHHQGVACEVNDRPSVNLTELVHKPHSTILALDGIEDPHNLGAIMRTAWLMGVEAIILPKERAVGLTPVVHKVACGGVEHVPLIEVTQFSTIFKTLKENGYWIFGLAAGGQNVLGRMTLPEKLVWVLGAEDRGMRSTTQRECDELIGIPQVDNAASYNVSVAAGITLFETLRNRPK